jgi:2-polyprenyl-3-methyl-5-hydroxy-6-metoxy-1,4-benzoquinol methylase
MNCKICNSTSIHFLDSTIFKEKQKIAYYKCSSCGFIQTEEAYWLEKAYSSVIAKTDIGLISRNIIFSNLTETMLDHFFSDTKKALDYGAGFGMFVRIMRDKGYHFLWHDDYCQNLFAETFEGTLTEKYDVLTAYEVFEHLPNPIETLEKLLSLSDTIIFSTVLNDGIEDFDTWWYRAEASGQHISFHSTQSLQFLAKKYNLNYYCANGKTLHVFTKKTINENHFNLIFNTNNTRINRLKRRLLIKPIVKKESLLQKDHKKIINQILHS